MKKKFAIAYHRLVLEFSNGKSFRRVTEEGYSGSQLPGVQRKGSSFIAPSVFLA
ncbi:hypothetical protein H6F98_16695 [Microcoleus sp. FACHB-SPT15]|uniref:hypothetical protein n=1 Tax=Microcoleus sp. FACHB-SPT15 TaxID=2692830 RepID=UPI00177EC6F3|nr:hypothetical protein [Microcoleus sp. FACHB-SPT15]MBD1807078.1 hypothetical protein [Microcoleus sp. FACHB-SPT15]